MSQSYYSKLRLKQKIFFPLVISGFIYMILVVLVARSVLISTFNHDTDKLIFSKINDFKQSCDEFSKKALFAASICTQFDFVQEAYEEYYKTNDLGSASKIIESRLNKIGSLIKENTGLEARIHYHLPPARSFVRSWSEKRGDDISGFRKTVLQVSETHKAVRGIETGRGGFVIRGISPIMSPNNKYLGSVEVFFDINKLVAQVTSNNDEEFSIFMNIGLIPISSKFLEDSSSNILTNKKIIGNYIFVEKTNGFDLQNLMPEELTRSFDELLIFQRGNYKYAIMPIKNFSGITEGIGVLQVDISDYKNNLLQVTLLLIGLSFILLLIVLFVVSKLLKNSLKRIFRLDESLKTLAKGKLSDKISVVNLDEIGTMEKSLNTLNVFISRNADFAIDLGKGNFDLDYKPMGEEDLLGNALVTMKKSLKNKNLQLIESEEGFRELSNMSFEGIIIHKDGVLIDANEAFLKMIRYTKQQLIGKNIIAMVVPEKYHRFLAEQRTMNYVKPYEIEAVREDGVVVPVEIESRDIKFKGVVRRVSAIRDITDRRKSEAVIQKLSLAIDQAFVAVVITNKEGQIEYVNPFFTSLTNYLPADVKGKTLCSFMDDEPHQGQKEIFEALSEGISWEGELVCRKKGGEKYTERTIVTPVKDENGEVTNFIAVKMDITHQKETEFALLEAKEKAEESDKLKSAFLANMSHEIRTPMNSIVGFSEMLDIPDIDDEDRNEFIKIIKSNSYRLLSLISDIIDISRIEAGHIELHIGKTNVNELLSKLYETYKFPVSERNIEFDLVSGLEDNLSIISTDGAKLNQILTNLINNASKFTHKGKIQIGYKLKSGLLEFFVSDTGIGIDKQYQESIFERFRQVEITTTKKYEGTGLGLSISKALCEKMGGKIWVDSEPEKGSTFYFTIPYKPVEIAHFTPVIENSENIDLVGKTILIAEDEHSNYLLLREMLKKTGANLLHVVNGLDAVEQCRSNSAIDMVLMDIKMPKMDGFEATKAIKKIRPDIFIIAQTAYAMVEDEKKAFEVGCDDFISKPLTKKLVLFKIDKLINSRRF